MAETKVKPPDISCKSCKKNVVKGVKCDCVYHFSCGERVKCIKIDEGLIICGDCINITSNKNQAIFEKIWKS